jgi:2-amino-4-hydroxy-6-hydroxymethyldihydropteridine diphosphokinase
MPEVLCALRVDTYIGIGSNLDNPIDHVMRGLRELGQIPDTEHVAHSSLYVGPPMGSSHQPDYVNAVARLRTALNPLVLLDDLLAIERAHGRVRTGEHWGPRTLDLDILLYGDCQIDSARLVVPHPGLSERAFVLYPLQELIGDIEVPGQGRLSALIARCPRGDLRRLEVA